MWRLSMNKKKNPFAIGFGLKPYEYIEQISIVDEVIDEFNSEYIQHPCYMLSGVRGAGKTVTMITIGDRLSKEKEWIVIRLNPESDLLKELAAKLYDTDKYWSDFINMEINLSKFGIGTAIQSKSPAASIESAIEIILVHMKKKGKRLLVEIDEVSNTKQIRQFAHSFQSFIGSELPIFLLMTGLHKNIKSLQDDASCTFLYRAEEMVLEPLNISKIARSYSKALEMDSESAWKLATLTRGYPVAYQIVGKYMWESEDKEINDEYLAHVDAALERYVYRKIWSELSDKDKWYLMFLAEKETMRVSDLLEISSQKKNEFSQYRERLIEKGIIYSPQRGVISWRLPRFENFVKANQGD